MSNLTLKEEHLLSYYITIHEIFNILKIRYPYVSNEKVLDILEKENIAFYYFDNTSFKESTDYAKNRVNQTINYNATPYNNYDGHNISIHTCILIENLRKY